MIENNTKHSYTISIIKKVWSNKILFSPTQSRILSDKNLYEVFSALVLSAFFCFRTEFALDAWWRLRNMWQNKQLSSISFIKNKYQYVKCIKSTKDSTIQSAFCKGDMTHSTTKIKSSSRQRRWWTCQYSHDDTQVSRGHHQADGRAAGHGYQCRR